MAERIWPEERIAPIEEEIASGFNSRDKKKTKA